MFSFKDTGTTNFLLLCPARFSPSAPRIPMAVHSQSEVGRIVSGPSSARGSSLWRGRLTTADDEDARVCHLMLYFSIL